MYLGQVRDLIRLTEFPNDVCAAAVRMRRTIDRILAEV
jgi:hypothetical protein